jgi:DNA-binding response OmpR family regulator
MQKILIVDDDTLLCEMLQMHLEREGYSVRAANGGFDAIKAVVNEDFDLVLSDINMPFLDGFAVLKAIRGHVSKSRSEVPVIFLTARNDGETREKAKSLGVTKYLTKPIPVDELTREIETSLAQALRGKLGSGSPPA